MSEPGEGGPSQLAERLVRRLIAEGAFAPGEKVSDLRLSKELSISRSHLRDAFQRLVKEGLLTALPQRGVRVSVIEGEELAELLELREILEVGAVRGAALRRRPEGLARLAEQLAVEQLSLTTPTRRPVLALTFHAELATLADNSLLRSKLDEVNLLLRLVRPEGPVSRDAVAHAEHQEIFAAIESGDARAAESAMRAHLSRSEQFLGLRRGGSPDE